MEILITVEESKGDESGLRWKAVFLAILLVSTVAVTLGVTVAELHVMNVPNRGFH